MSLHIRKKTETAYHPVFLEILSDIQSGVTIATGRLKTTSKMLEKGAVLGESPDTSGIYHLCKSVEVYNNNDATLTTINVLKAHEFKVGEYISDGAFSTSITSIDASNSSYDVFALNDNLPVKDGDKLYESTSEGGTDADLAQKFTPKGILRDSVKVLEYDDEGCLTTLNNVFGAVVTRGTVNESGMPYPPAGVQKTSLTDRIRFA